MSLHSNDERFLELAMAQPWGERLLSKIEIRPNEPDACWLWTAAISDTGYGSFRLANSTQNAHRLAYSITHGAPGSRECVLHRCDVRSCVRPSHLFLGTHQDNMRDCAEKLRFRNGKLTPGKALEVLAMIRGGARNRDVAREFGLDESFVSRIRSGQRWAHLLDATPANDTTRESA